MNTDFPSPIPSNMWGEPSMIISAEEEKCVDAQFTVFGLMYLFFCLFLIEFLIRILIFLVRKFIFKKSDAKKIKNKKTIVKVIGIIYSILFYIGFISPMYLLFGVFYEVCFP